MRFNCTVNTSDDADVYIRFGADTGPGCQSERHTRTSTDDTSHELVLFGMKATPDGGPTQHYDWKAYATPTAGGATITSACGSVATGELPEGPGTSQLEHMTVSTSVGSGTRAVNNFLTHYGCVANLSGDPEQDALIVVDSDGDIVWYQEPAIDLGYSEEDQVVMEALSLSRPDKHILAVINHEIVVEYTLEGELVHVFCRGDSASGCPNITETADVYFEGYAHHAVEKFGDEIYVLSAKEVDVPDVDDCDGDEDETEMTSIVMDGMYMFDVSGTLTMALDWDWSDVPEVTVDYTVADPDLTWGCGSGYWNGTLTGVDYLHTNSCWLDLLGQGTFSIHNLDDVWWVDGAGGGKDRTTVLDGGNLEGDYTFASGGINEAFDGQHDARWGPSSDAELVMFDNQYDAGGPARGVSFDFLGSGTVTATHEYEMRDIAGDPLECPSGGSAIKMTGDNLFATCPAATVSGPDYAVFNDFYLDPGSGAVSIAWTVELECASGYASTDKAFRGYANLW